MPRLSFLSSFQGLFGAGGVLLFGWWGGVTVVAGYCCLCGVRFLAAVSLFADVMFSLVVLLLRVVVWCGVLLLVAICSRWWFVCFGVLLGSMAMTRYVEQRTTQIFEIVLQICPPIWALRSGLVDRGVRRW